MTIKKNINKLVFLFLLSHLILWTFIPTITNINLPLDTIEALAWGSNLDWGFNKHPPLSAATVEVFFKLFGNQDWAYYLLSQIFIIVAFVSVFKLANEFFNDTKLAFFSILLLEGIYFFNYTSPEFNVNIAQLPFWSLSILFTWRCIKDDKAIDFALLGIFMGLGFLSKYLFFYLILGIKFLFLYLIIKKKIKSLKYLITGPVALIIILPHLFWLLENNFVTITYGLQRTESGENFFYHIIYPLIFIIKQLGVLLPFFLMGYFLLKRLKIKKVIISEKIIFLLFTFVLPVLLMVTTSVVFGAKIRTMWMTPFYLLAGVMFIEIFKRNLNLKKLKKFYLVFLLFFLFSPTLYAIVSLTNDYKRTDYPGEEIARLVQNKWDDNFNNEIKIVIGDEWFAGNLSYHLESRPRWFIELSNNSENLKMNEGVIYTGNPKILKNVCPGVYGTIKPVGYCMIGQR